MHERKLLFRVRLILITLKIPEHSRIDILTVCQQSAIRTNILKKKTTPGEWIHSTPLPVLDMLIELL